MENRQGKEMAASNAIEKSVKSAEMEEVTIYGDYKVISTFSDSGLTLTDALSHYIDRMASLKY